MNRRQKKKYKDQFHLFLGKRIFVNHASFRRAIRKGRYEAIKLALNLRFSESSVQE